MLTTKSMTHGPLTSSLYRPLTEEKMLGLCWQVLSSLRALFGVRVRSASSVRGFVDISTGFPFAFGVLQEYYSSHEPFASDSSHSATIGTVALVSGASTLCKSCQLTSAGFHVSRISIRPHHHAALPPVPQAQHHRGRPAGDRQHCRLLVRHPHLATDHHPRHLLGPRRQPALLPHPHLH